MSYNIVTDPDDLLRIEIPPNVMRDMESVVKRIEGLLPSLYMDLKKVLEKAPPGSPEQAKYRSELRIIERILRFLDDPEESRLIGAPFQPIEIVGGYMRGILNMVTFTYQFWVPKPTTCLIMVFPAVIMLPDNMLRTSLVHELIHCVAGELNEWATHLVEEMLADLAPDLFPATQYELEHMILLIPEDIAAAVLNYIKQNRVPVISIETFDAVVDRFATDTEYTKQIFRKSVIVRLKPSASWKKKS